VTASTICPAESNGPFSNDYIYFGARMMPLESEESFDFFAMSYLGSAEFAHHSKVFDALIPASYFSEERVDLKEPFGLIGGWLEQHHYTDLAFGEGNDYGYSALFSYNTGDVDLDGKPDFIFDEALALSSKEYNFSTDAPRRSIFHQNAVIAILGNEIVKYELEDGRLVNRLNIDLNSAAHDNIPYVILPLSKDKLGVRTQVGMDIYSHTDNNIEWFASIDGFSEGEIQTGGFGDFTGNGVDDVWFSQVATPTPYPNKEDQIILLQISDINPGKNSIKDVAWMTIHGSSEYSDYDGIGTSLSLKAGDIDGDGNPDFSFTGHRHMNEAGALYILPGSAVNKGLQISTNDNRVIKILGRDMSQLAPPFHHWDATDFDDDGYDDIIVTADNDLCSGLHAGSVLRLSGKTILDKWKEKQSAM